MITVTAIPAFNDNYIWLIRERQGDCCAVVDPGDGQAVLNVLNEIPDKLTDILITHHHHDHTGGLELLTSTCDVTVWGPESTIRGINNVVKQGDTASIFNGLVNFSVLEVPGHTLDHIAFYDGKHLFCGDTLFAGGCGRLFEGSYEQLYTSLQKLAELPPESKVYCAHEYTLANLQFALAVEPNNKALLARKHLCEKSRELHKPTVPSRLSEELVSNPFLRCGQASVKQAAEKQMGHELSTEVEVFKTIRQWKDNF